jgi:hypothetical protein
MPFDRAIKGLRTKAPIRGLISQRYRNIGAEGVLAHLYHFRIVGGDSDGFAASLAPGKSLPLHHWPHKALVARNRAAISRRFAITSAM